MPGFLDTDLLVLGAGAKATAIAMKAHVLNSLGLGPIDLTIVEASGPASAWLDGNGVTSSREVLAISPAKDIGFPYEARRAFGEMGEAIDRAALRFSWQQHLIGEGRYARWVNAGSPPVQRRVYGRYLGWVLSGATRGVRLVRGRVERVTLDPDGERWVIDVASEPRRIRCRAFVLTGPGIHRAIPHDPPIAARILDCDGGRIRIAEAPPRECSEIAIIGGGESALSCIEYVRALRPDARLTIYTPRLPMSRVESFLENRVFADPDEVGWSSLPVNVRRDFIARSDRGVFGPERLEAFAFDDGCEWITGRVTHIARAAIGPGVSVRCDSRAGTVERPHDYVINCTGSDLLEQLRVLCPAPVRAEIERRAGGVWDAPPEQEIRFGRFLELEGMLPRLHVPGLAALSQGPGFSNLGSLGLTADRVLQPYGLGEGGPGERPVDDRVEVQRVADEGAGPARVSDPRG